MVSNFYDTPVPNKMNSLLICGNNDVSYKTGTHLDEYCVLQILDKFFEIRELEAAVKIQRFIRPKITPNIEWHGFFLAEPEIEHDLEDLDNMFGPEYSSDNAGDGPDSKQARRSQYQKKQKDKRKAAEKRAKSDQARKERIEEHLEIHGKDGSWKKKPPKFLNSQSGKQKTFTFVTFVTFFVSSYLFNKAMFPVILDYFTVNGVDSISFVFKFFEIIRTSFNTSTASLDGFVSETKEKLNKLTSDLKMPSLEPYMDSLSTLLKNIKYVRRCALVSQIFDIVNIVVTLGWLSHIEWTFKGVSLFKSESLRRQVSVMDLVESIGKFIKTFVFLFLCIS
jgi:hypothetical protein